MTIKSKYRLAMFDLDGTLTPSKSTPDSEMIELIPQLLNVLSVGIISGASFSQFKKQILSSLSLTPAQYKSLYLFPVNGSSFYTYNEQKGWEMMYAELLSPQDKRSITRAFEQALRETGVDYISGTYGDILEDRGSQITFSGCGQNAPLEIKEKWDPTFEKRQRLKVVLDPLLPQYQIGIAGKSSIDVTRQGLDKEFGINKIAARLKLEKDQILYVGDALFPGGNDYPAVRAGVDTISVQGPQDTKRVMRELIGAILSVEVPAMSSQPI